MAKLPILESPDGRVQRVITSQDELDSFKERGYTAVGRGQHSTTERDAIDSGAEGNRRSRAAATTRSSERNSGTESADES